MQVLQINDDRFEIIRKLLTFELAHAVVLMILVFVLCYRPFVFELFIPAMLRLTIEASLIVSLLVLNFRRRFIGYEFIWLLPYLFIVLANLLWGPHALNDLLSQLNKVVILFSIFFTLFF